MTNETKINLAGSAIVLALGAVTYWLVTLGLGAKSIATAMGCLLLFGAGAALLARGAGEEFRKSERSNGMVCAVSSAVSAVMGIGCFAIAVVQG